MKAIPALLLVSLVSTFVPASAPGADNKELILGKWAPDDGKGKGIEAVIEFAKDGSFRIDHRPRLRLLVTKITESAKTI